MWEFNEWIRLSILYLLGCRIWGIFKNYGKVEIQSQSCPLPIDPVSRHLTLLNISVVALRNWLSWNREIFLGRGNKHIQNSYNPKSYYQKPANKRLPIREVSATAWHSTNASNPTPSITACPCMILLTLSYNISMKLNARTPNPLTYRKDKK